jgi:hypothetical protein
MRDQKQARHQFDKSCLKKSFFVEQIESLKHMNEEIVDDDNVQGCLRRQPSFRDQEQARTSVEHTREQKDKAFKCDECPLWI